MSDQPRKSRWGNQQPAATPTNPPPSQKPDPQQQVQLPQPKPAGLGGLAGLSKPTTNPLAGLSTAATTTQQQQPHIAGGASANLQSNLTKPMGLAGLSNKPNISFGLGALSKPTGLAGLSKPQQPTATTTTTPSSLSQIGQSESTTTAPQQPQQETNTTTTTATTTTTEKKPPTVRYLTAQEAQSFAPTGFDDNGNLLDQQGNIVKIQVEKKEPNDLLKPNQSGTKRPLQQVKYSDDGEVEDETGKDFSIDQTTQMKQTTKDLPRKLRRLEV